MPNVDDAVRSAAAQLGQRGGAARAARMSPEERSEAARRAAIARWGGQITPPRDPYRDLSPVTIEILNSLGR